MNFPDFDQVNLLLHDEEDVLTRCPVNGSLCNCTTCNKSCYDKETERIINEIEEEKKRLVEIQKEREALWRRNYNKRVKSAEFAASSNYDEFERQVIELNKELMDNAQMCNGEITLSPFATESEAFILMIFDNLGKTQIITYSNQNLLGILSNNYMELKKEGYSFGYALVDNSDINEIILLLKIKNNMPINPSSVKIDNKYFVSSRAIKKYFDQCYGIKVNKYLRKSENSDFYYKVRYFPVMDSNGEMFYLFLKEDIAKYLREKNNK